MRSDEIREMSDADMRERIAELEEERFRLRFRAATETLEEPLRLRTLRKDIARMKTIMRERALAAAAKSAAAPAGGRAARGSRRRATRQ